MPRLLSFDRLARRFLRKPESELVMTVTTRAPVSSSSSVHIDVAALAKEMAQYDVKIRERLRRAALRAIDEELATIRAERKAES